MELNRINWAKLCILRYGEKYFEQFRILVDPQLSESTNMPSHGLHRNELVIVLHDLFESGALVARRADRHLFTPTLAEIEEFLNEPDDLNFEDISFFGNTAGAFELLENLREAKLPHSG